MYYFLHLYAEAVLPDNYGVRKHPCFCLPCGKKKRGAQTADDEQARRNSIAGDAEIDAEMGKLRRVGTENFSSNDPIQLKRVTM